jgi:RNA polymerase sigma-70 factor (ECF subfamily)
VEDFADFDFFFKEYYVSLYSYAHSLINNWEVSRDIASDAFEYIWKNFDRIEKATAKSYLFIYVRNRAIDYLRHQDIHYAYAEFSQKLYENYTEVEFKEQDERTYIKRYDLAVAFSILSKFFHIYSKASLAMSRLTSQLLMRECA